MRELFLLLLCSRSASQAAAEMWCSSSALHQDCRLKMPRPLFLCFSLGCATVVRAKKVCLYRDNCEPQWILGLIGLFGCEIVLTATLTVWQLIVFFSLCVTPHPRYNLAFKQGVTIGIMGKGSSSPLQEETFVSRSFFSRFFCCFTLII